MSTDTRTSNSQTAIGTLRSFITLLVVAHHSFIAYGQYQRFDPAHYLDGAPLVDERRWVGFDVFILFNDTFFMALMFFVSGLFVWPSVQRKGEGAFLRDRLVRLGVPFVCAVLFVMPLAYYPSFLGTGARISFVSFWKNVLTDGPWPGGPAWFLWVLFVYGCAALFLTRFFRSPLRLLSALDIRARTRPLPLFACFLACSATSYLPMLAAFGPDHWFSWGPFAVQASRVLHYGSYFLFGVGLGATTFSKGLLSDGGALSKAWHGWALTGCLAFALIVAANLARLDGLLNWPENRWKYAYGTLFVVASGAQSWGLIALSLRFAVLRPAWLDRFGPHAYTVYVVHYPFVVWSQRMLLDFAVPAWLKAACVLLLSIAGSWATSLVLKRVLARATAVKRGDSAPVPGSSV
jgi:peptidoglycan/LPS O-acetylase OafA/YrhL